jgi:hypothetical protein
MLFQSDEIRIYRLCPFLPFFFISGQFQISPHNFLQGLSKSCHFVGRVNDLARRKIGLLHEQMSNQKSVQPLFKGPFCEKQSHRQGVAQPTVNGLSHFHHH